VGVSVPHIAANRATGAGTCVASNVWLLSGIVFDAPLALLVFGDGDVEVEVELAVD